MKTDVEADVESAELFPGLAKAVSVVPEAIEEEFVRTPADVAFWNARYADALEEHLHAKAHADAEWARLWLLTRSELAADGGKAPTEKVIDATTEGKAEWQEAQLKLIKAEAKKARLQGAVDAVHTKRDMVQSLGAKLRVEMQTDPQVAQRERQMHGRDLAR